MVILIKEFLPNPKGADALNEWIKVYNDGTEAVNLAGWKLGTDAKHSFSIKEILSPRAEIIFSSRDTGLQLRNTGGEVYLWNSNGQVVDRVAYGKAGEGIAMTHAGSPLLSQLFEQDLPPLKPLPDNFQMNFFITMFGAALVLCGVCLYVIRKLEIEI